MTESSRRVNALEKKWIDNEIESWTLPSTRANPPMAEPTVICPKCKNEIKLTESLAAPLVESARQEYEKRLAQKDVDISTRENAVRKQLDEVAKAKEAIETQVAERLKEERKKIAADEERKAKFALGGELEQKAKEIHDLHE